MLADMAVALNAARLSLRQAALSADPFPNSLLAAQGEDHRFRDGQHGHEPGAAAVRRQRLLAGLSPRTYGSKCLHVHHCRRHGAGVEKVASRILGTKIPQTRNGHLEAVQAPSLAAK
jgi:hypothetical protein